ncbi:TetR/AcrR family transcriptional regulator [Leucobacter luti]|uniref:TetR family transcriptional regulator n=1 Tax=Leucobacter luti TaxID=340320 RepID=A0A4V6MDP6_9MICO|nr:TetR/AcrR family transcriptional regulator [Leucobacter luti]MBL3700980.1 TetR/AcrR family transcriptional regulator [Leucobacter luti]RZT68799.1 TetR family transcriptional regulator [Leucobacter luti]
MTAEPVTRPPSLRERRQERTRHELVDAVLVVIGESGLDGATIERVSAQSGISRGTVYAHFPGGRDELLRAAYARLGSELVERTRAAVDESGDWRGRLVAHARAMFDLAADQHLGHFFNVSGPTLISDGAERGIGSGASALMIEADLRAAQLRGEVSADVDPAATATLLVGALREAAIRVAAGGSDAERAYAAFARLADGLAAH